MKSWPLHKRDKQRVRLAAAVALLIVLLPVRTMMAQRGAEPAPPAAAAKPAAPTDPLGRDTPRGTLLGFMRAAREGNYEAAPHYLNTALRGEAARKLARELYVVLDRRLPVRLTEISDSPDGSRADPLRPDHDVVGAIETADGPLELAVERITRGATPVWLFSRRTLDGIPAAYDDINLISLDDYLPRGVTRPRLFGIRLFGWLLIALAVPLAYRLMGTVGVSGTVRLLALALAIRWLVGSVDLPLRERQLWTTVSALLAMISGVWMLLHLNAYGARYVQQHFRDARFAQISSLVQLGRRIADVLAIAAGIIVALAYFGIDPTAALAGLGIGGIAVALAAQKTLENVIGGLSLVFDKAVRVGDFLRLGEGMGTVESIGLRSTRIRTLERTLLSVPNGQIANTSLETLSARDMCWFHHTIGLRYETTAAQIRRVLDGIHDRLTAHPDVDAGTVRVRLFRFGASSLDLEVVAYVKTGDWARFLEAQEQLLVAFIDVVERSGAAIAFPTQTLHLAGDRNRQMLAAAIPLQRDTGVESTRVHVQDRQATGT